MIKINLALRKQSAGVVGGGNTQLSRSFFKIDAKLDGIQDLPIKKVVALLLLYLVGNYLVDNFTKKQTDEVSATIAKLTEEQTVLKKGLGKFSNYDQIRKALEADESMIQTKIKTVKALIAERQTPPKLMITLSTTTPNDVWLDDLKITEEEIKIKGHSLSFNQISDFMKNLDDSVYFDEVKLQNAQTDRDVSGVEVSSFELTAKREGKILTSK
jgi:Tfp pilus assembly protein PilN